MGERLIPLSIGIAGAGVCGLAAAIALARDGASVVVFDQFDAPRPVGAGLMLQETGLAVLGALGLRETIENLGAPIRRLLGVSISSGRTVLDVRYAALRDGLTGLGVQRTALFNVLFDAAKANGVDITPNVRVTEADSTEGTLTDDRGRRHGPFDLVVDALGARSVLSQQPKQDLAYGALWTTVPAPTGAPFQQDALQQRYLAARQMAGVMPSGRTQPEAKAMATYFWSLRTDAYDAFRTAPLAAWKQEAVALWPETAPVLDHIKTHDDLAFARYRHRTHRPHTDGRIAHTGDSWHATSPQLGQGANMALLDAYALALAMRETSNVATGLSRYAQLRSGHIHLFQTMSWLFTPIYQSDSTLLPAVRDWAIAPISRLPLVRKLQAAMVSGALGAPLAPLGLNG
ncbi:MAG: NAD(P)/FAD-dependent oxidoreductase [Pseudomonadota bacterium]